jgi:hypothetical protein
MQLYYNRRGEPMTMEEWAAAFQREDRILAQTDLGTLGRVSTIWLGLDHNHGRGRPIIFETMVFGGPLDQEMLRYYTEEQAREGHEFILQALMYYQPEKRPPLIHNGRKPRR